MSATVLLFIVLVWSRYDRNVTAMQDSELAYLRKDDVMQLSEKHPELKNQVR